MEDSFIAIVEQARENSHEIAERGAA